MPCFYALSALLPFLAAASLTSAYNKLQTVPGLRIPALSRQSETNKQIHLAASPLRPPPNGLQLMPNGGVQGSSRIFTLEDKPDILWARS